MTTRTMPETHEARVRDLAELPDSRFASLRGVEHRYGPDGRCWECKAEHFEDDLEGDIEYTYCLRTDGDALDEAIAACGFFEVRVWHHDGVYVASIIAVADYDPIPLAVESGPTSREAKSAALWQAILGVA